MGQIGLYIAGLEEVGKATALPRNTYALVWIHHGTGKQDVDFQEITLRPGALYILPPGAIYRIIPESGAEGFFISFTQELTGLTGLPLTFLSWWLSPPIPPPLQTHAAFEEKTLTWMRTVQRIQEQRKTLEKEFAAGYLRVLLLHIRELYLSQAPAPGLKPGAQDILSGFYRLLHQFIRKAHSVSFYAEHLGISPGYLNSLVRTAGGKTAKALIRERLLLEARREAVLRNATQTEAARRLGFYDPAHFSHFFKQGAGCTFLEFRKHYREVLGYYPPEDL